MKHEQILEQLLVKAKSDHNIVGFLVFGSVATGTHHEKSDIDVITVFRKQKPSSGIKNTVTDGIKIGNIF
ncbi:MAG: nucleotidyltransferase domain-containing protein, partial [Candidatus Bathyarchaeota archaeon]|nr:nucleotidyltransferase domain-containing protein [Candidatus Bathyarchaeota archaeon]